MPDRAPTLFLSAGDTSGDALAASIVEELRARLPAARFVAFGGPWLRAAGVEILEPLAERPVMGFAAVLPAIGRFVRLLNAADRWLGSVRPDLVIPVDYPGFNVRLARLARRRGLRTIYLVCPQYWGWAPWRARRFAQAVDLCLTLFPFETRFLESHGVAARCVGHPLADRIAGAPAGGGGESLAILPGSRLREIERVLPWQLRAARRFGEGAAATPRLLAAHGDRDARELMLRIAAREGIALEVRDAPLHAILADSRAALVTSGTATLECALLRTPSVVLYAVDGFSLRASRFVLTSPFIALPNLLRGRIVFPEHLAARDPSEAVARDLAGLWGDGPERSRCLIELDALRSAMLAPGAAARAADEIVAQLR